MVHAVVHPLVHLVADRHDWDLPHRPDRDHLDRDHLVLDLAAQLVAGRPEEVHPRRVDRAADRELVVHPVLLVREAELHRDQFLACHRDRADLQVEVVEDGRRPLCPVEAEVVAAA